jgi:AcrR family transcriptional regulator
MATAEKEKPRRTASREQRRQQLIDATMKCIGRKGLTGTTLSDVAKEAGLSQGIVNLHFESKDNLLTETLLSLANDYRTQFDKALDRAGPAAADKLLAIVEHDLRPSILDRRKLAVWFAFWGEVKSRPTYRRICDAHDRYYDEVVASLCDKLIEEGDYTGITGIAAAEALTSMSNGLWLGCLLGPQNWDRQLARDAVDSYLKSVFPKHFD